MGSDEPSPAELLWRISWLAGLAPKPPPEQARPVTLRTVLDRAIEERADRLLREIDAHRPRVVSLYRASIPWDQAEVLRQVAREAERWKRRRACVGRP